MAAWQQHFASHGWDAHAGMGQPRQPLSSGITGVCAWVATQTSNPGSLFALGYPLSCLLLLGLGAGYAVRQLGGAAAACGLGAVAAALSGGDLCCCNGTAVATSEEISDAAAAEISAVATVPRFQPRPGPNRRD